MNAPDEKQPNTAPGPPEGFRLIHQGTPLPPFYAAEMLRPYLGRTIWAADAGGRTRCGELATVPWVKEDQTENVPPASFKDERPLYLRQIVCLAVYEPKR